MRLFVYKTMYENEMSHAWYLATRFVLLDFLKKRLSNKAKILDAGCGTGGTIIFLKRNGFKNASGIDLSPEAIKFCIKRNINEVKVASVNKLPFKSNTFDALICMDVLYHKGVDHSKAIKEYKRVLKKDGILYLQEPSYNWLKSSHDLAINTASRFTRPEMKKLLESNNFEIEKLTYFNFSFLFIIILKRLAQKFFTPNKVDIEISNLPPTLNTVILKVLSFEALLIKKINWPFGLSVICLSRNIKND